MGSVLGLDIGTSAIKAVIFEESLKGEKVTAFYHLPYAQPDRAHILEDFFSLLDEEGKSFDRVAASLNGYEGSIRIVELPFEDKAKVGSVLPFELESEFADGSADKEFWFHEIPNRDGEENRAYLCLAAARERIHEVTDEYIRSGFRPRILDFEPFADFNSFSHSSDGTPEGICVLLDIGSRSTSINLIQDGLLVFTRTVFFGGNDFTSAIAEELNMSFEDSEELKFEYGLHQGDEGDANRKVDQALLASLKTLSKEIDLTLGAYWSRMGSIPISSVMLCGGGSALSGLKEYLEREYEVTVKEVSPFAGLRLQIPVPECALLYSVAAGLALHALGLGKIQHNLLPMRPPVDTFVQKRLSSHCTAVFLLALVCCICIGGEVGLSYWIFQELEEQYHQETRAILQKQKENFKTLGALQKKIRERKKLLEEFSRAEKSPIHVLNYLSSPEAAGIELTLDEVHLENKDADTRVILRGSVPYAPDIRRLETLLQSVPYIRKVILGPVEQSQLSGRYEFKEIDLIL